MNIEKNMALRSWWMEQIREITRKTIEAENKRQEKVKRQNLKKLGDYKTYNDIQEAYGVGVITEKQFDRLADLLEKSRPEPDDLYRAKIDLLQEVYQEQKKIYAELLDWEVRHGQDAG